MATKPTEWREARFGDATVLVRDTWRPGQEEEAYIGLEHINEGDLTLKGIGRSTLLESNKTRFQSGDILFGKLRPYFRKVVVPDFAGVCSTDIWVIRAKEGYDQRYLFYFVANPVFVAQSSGASKGTKMPRADWDYLSNKEYNFPDLPEQREIASVLSSLDDKIKLLRKQNKTLEEMARAIFDEWFVKKTADGVLPEGWRSGKIMNLCSKIASGGTPNTRNSDYYGGTIWWFSTKELNDNFLFASEKKITKEGLENSSAKLFPAGSVVMAIYAAPTVGRLGILTKESSFNQAAVGFIADERVSSSEFIYLYLLSERDTLNNLANGAAQQNISVGLVREHPVVIPGRSAMTRINGTIRPLFRKILNNSTQMQTLSSTRDLLLPKLMSGKVRV